MAKKKPTPEVKEKTEVAQTEAMTLPLTLDALCIYGHTENQDEDVPGPHSFEFRPVADDKRFVRGKIALNCESHPGFVLGEVYSITIAEK